MTDDVDVLRAENAALRAENDAFKARYDPARRTWAVSEISAMDHATYTENERQILAAFREGRIVRDPDADDPQTTTPAAVPAREQSERAR